MLSGERKAEEPAEGMPHYIDRLQSQMIDQRHAVAGHVSQLYWATDPGLT